MKSAKNSLLANLLFLTLFASAVFAFETLPQCAYALGCAEIWADGFADILAKASYTPSWDRTDNRSGGGGKGW
jgi:hypothetical protein